MIFLTPKHWIDILRFWNRTLKIGWECRLHPHWTLLYSSLNGTMQCSARISAVLAHRRQVRRKGAIQGLTAKVRAPKWVNHNRALQLALLLVKIASRSPNYLENISSSRNQYIKLQISGGKPACSICLGCLMQSKQNKKPFQFPFRKTKGQKKVY